MKCFKGLKQENSIPTKQSSKKFIIINIYNQAYFFMISGI